MSRNSDRRGPATARVAVLVLAMVVASGCGQSGAPHIELGPALASAPQGGVTQVVFDMTNTGDGADRLVAVDTEAALGAEIHRTLTEEGRADMEPVDAVEVPPGETVAFEQDHLHLMLIAPRHTVTPGSTFELTLDFQRSGARRLEVEVVEQQQLRL